MGIEVELSIRRDEPDPCRGRVGAFFGFTFCAFAAAAVVVVVNADVDAAVDVDACALAGVSVTTGLSWTSEARAGSVRASAGRGECLGVVLFDDRGVFSTVVRLEGALDGDMTGVGTSGALDPRDGGGGIWILLGCGSSHALSALWPCGRAPIAGALVRSVIMRWSESPLIVDEKRLPRGGEVEERPQDESGDLLLDLSDAISLPSSSDSDIHSGSLQPFCCAMLR